MNISFTHVSLIFTTAANMYGMCQFEVAPAERKKKSVKPECLHQAGLVIAEKAKTSESETQQLDGPLQMQRSSLWCCGLMFYCTNGAESCSHYWMFFRDWAQPCCASRIKSVKSLQR